MDLNFIIPLLQFLAIPNRKFEIAMWYLSSLMLPADKHSQINAAMISGKENSLFSKFLSGSLNASTVALNRATRRKIEKLMKVRKPLVAGAPWRITILIDATLHERSSRHIENSQKFNHGKGWITGHQWTNIVILINGVVVPLPPIPFYTKDECKKRKIKYQTEIKKLSSYFKTLGLTSILGVHQKEEIVVLMDSGYDAKALQSVIISRGWDYICSIKSSRTVSIVKSKLNPRAKSWINISNYFSDGRLAWKSIRIATYRGKKRVQKLRLHRVKQREAFLKGVHHKVQIVCSERSHESKKKFMSCTNLNVNIKQIILAYRERWKIELFHRDVKSYLGFEDAGVRKFDSLHAHIHWVYCAYILLLDFFPTASGVKDAQNLFLKKIELQANKKMMQSLSQINGADKVKSQCRSVIREVESLLAA
jgi:hypothetical protein